MGATRLLAAGTGLGSFRVEALLAATTRTTRARVPWLEQPTTFLPWATRRVRSGGGHP